MAAENNVELTNCYEENIKIIESTNGQQFGMIKKENTLQSYTERQWFIVRLAIN